MLDAVRSMISTKADYQDFQALKEKSEHVHADFALIGKKVEHMQSEIAEVVQTQLFEAARRPCDSNLGPAVWSLHL